MKYTITEPNSTQVVGVDELRGFIMGCFMGDGESIQFASSAVTHVMHELDNYGRCSFAVQKVFTIETE